MTASARSLKLRELRLRQPLEELERKARKAVSRYRYWTQEELDFASARGRDLSKALKLLCVDD